MIKRLILAVIFIAIVCGGLVGFNLFRSQAIKDYFANLQQPAVAVSTSTVVPSEWTPGIEAVGSARAGDGVTLKFQVDGIVTDIKFKANQQVAKGDLLVQLDDKIQQADLAAAKADAVLSEQNLKRAQTLRTQGVGAVSNVDATAAAAAAAQALVVKLESTLALKQLVAPFSGVIGISRIDVGEYVTPGTEIATLQNLETMRVDFTVPEQQLPNLAIGQKVVITTSEDDYRFNGAITGIDPRIDASSRLISVQAQVENSQRTLTPGQFVRVKVVLPTEENIITLPQTAIVSSLYGDYVYKVMPKDNADTPADAKAELKDKASTDGKAQEDLIVRQVFVKLGRRTDARIEITDGIKDGDIIVNAGQNRLSSGMRVMIDNTVNPEDALKQKQ